MSTAGGLLGVIWRETASADRFTWRDNRFRVTVDIEGDLVAFFWRPNRETVESVAEMTDLPRVGETMQATGEFEVDLQPLDPFAKGTEGITLGRMSIDKTFRGDLVAKSQGEMLSVVTPVKGSAGYVAVEQVSGTLRGKSSAFVLQHFGIMGRGENRLVLEVVPDSGTGQLANISGIVTIRIEDGKHSYAFNYSLA